MLVGHKTQGKLSVSAVRPWGVDLGMCMACPDWPH